MPDPSGHTKPLFERDQARTFWLPEVGYLAQSVAPDTPPTVAWTFNDDLPRLDLATGLGRKTMTVVVDAENAVGEADEQNNQATVEYIVGDGRTASDRERLAANDVVRGLNDLAVGSLRLRSNTQLIRAGYVQRPTQLDALISNPRLAGCCAG